MPHIMTVCTANICRSPLAEAVLRQALEVNGYQADWTVDSAGTWATVERGAARFTVQAAQARGLDVSNHRARMLDGAMMEKADLVLCMTASHVEALRLEFPDHRHKVFMLSEMIGKRFDVADPYGGERAEYEQMAEDVTRLLDEGLPRIVDLAQTNQQQRVAPSAAVRK